MCQEPTELLWIGCLTWLISTLKFRFDTLIANINSQTFWPRVISHVTNGIIFFICSTLAISAPLAALRIPAWSAAPKRWRKGMQEQKGEERSVTISKSTAMKLSSRVPTRSSSAKSLVASKSREILIATGKPEKAGWEEIRNPTQRRVLKRNWQMNTLKGWWTKPQRNLSQQKEESGDVDLAESEIGSEEETVLARLVAYKTGYGETYASSNSDCQGSPKAERTEW